MLAIIQGIKNIAHISRGFGLQSPVTINHSKSRLIRKRVSLIWLQPGSKRWSTFLIIFSVEIFYIKGEDNQNADPLSRLCSNVGKLKSDDRYEELMLHISSFVEHITLEKIQRKTLNDHVLSRVIELHKKGWTGLLNRRTYNLFF